MPRSGSSPSRVAPVGRWSRVYLPDSQPPPSGPPRQQTEAVVLARRHDLELDPAHEQAVGGLQGHRHGQLLPLGQIDGPLHLPTGEVGQAGVADLARVDGVVQEAQRLLQRRERIPRVQLVEVDVVDPEPAQRRIEGPTQVTAGVAQGVGLVAHGEPALGGEDDAIADVGRPRGKPAAENFLRGTVGVDVGGVDQRAAALDEDVELLVSLRFVGLRAEGHGAQAQSRDGAPTATQRAVFHDRSPVRRHSEHCLQEATRQAMLLSGHGADPARGGRGLTCRRRPARSR
jgi:hypothetical protein